MKLVKPTIHLKKEYLEMLEDWKFSNEDMVPFSLRYDASDFEEFIRKNEKFEVEPQKGFVCHSTYWLLDRGNEIIGTSNIRHELNDDLLIENGHIGYGVRPSFRRKGYAGKMLELSLNKAKCLGIKKALLTCKESNIGSARVIVKNGGVLRREQFVNGEKILSFWIDIE